MPPAAMASRVTSTSSSQLSLRLDRSARASRYSSTIGWGNLGAPPQPPSRRSTDRVEFLVRPVEDGCVVGRPAPVGRPRPVAGGSRTALAQLAAQVGLRGCSRPRRRPRGSGGTRACPGAARAGSRCRRRRGARPGSARRSAASRPGRSGPAPPPCRRRRGRGAPPGRP